MIKLFVGLGNPGPEYEATRHNAGFWLVDNLAQAQGCTLSRETRFQALAGRTRITGQEVWLLEGDCKVYAEPPPISPARRSAIGTPRVRIPTSRSGAPGRTPPAARTAARSEPRSPPSRRSPCAACSTTSSGRGCASHCRPLPDAAMTVRAARDA